MNLARLHRINLTKLIMIIYLFIYSYFSSELDKDFTHEFNNLRPNSRQIKFRKRKENNWVSVDIIRINN